MTTAVLLGTAAAGPVGPATQLPGTATTPLDRLQAQLSGRGVSAGLLAQGTDACADLDALAELLEGAAPGPVLLVAADLVASSALLDVVLVDPRPAVTTLVGPPGAPWPVRVAGGVVTAAASALHELSAPTGSALGLLRVPQAQRADVAAVARTAARQLREQPLPVLPGAAPAQDALALLLVALVRSGCRVRTVPLRGFVGGRAFDAQSTAAVAERLAEVDEDDARMNAAVKPDDGFVGTFFVSPYSKRLARAAARRGIRPNAITVTSMGLGVVTAALYAQGDRLALVLGAVVLHIALTLDLVDGQLARYAGAFSSLGAYLDAVFDRVKEYLVYAGLAIGASRHGDDLWTVAAIALLLQTTHHALQFSWPGGEQPQVRPVQGPLTVRELEPPAMAGPGRIAVAASARTQGNPVTRWGKRILQFPIAERFLVLSLGPALAGPRVALTVFIIWVCAALAWSLTGRTLRSVSR